MIPPAAGFAAGKLYGLKSTSTGPVWFVPAGPFNVMPVAAPVKSVNPGAEPYPTVSMSMEVSVSKTMPPEIVPPVPLLPATAGTSLDGLSPAAASVPEGERPKGIKAAWLKATKDNNAVAAKIFFILLLSYITLNRRCLFICFCCCYNNYHYLKQEPLKMSMKSPQIFMQ